MASHEWIGHPNMNAAYHDEGKKSLLDIRHHTSVAENGQLVNMGAQQRQAQML